ncbi:signal transduction histidine kinase [Actinoplanes octamycinicus]|uniref:histidine kinase n=1 Tax=Actinoplanes octamycinicus TaxID=135948 RepID=A0A7W7GTB4_9ACTN|nr:ATP-binding protein [Actinoplanes octamycinicus]MBB4737889.1 signal transduction histidine kinase [Actinoplanes octamycinicus]GIE59058.1 histidine kinase [Actinoplanes octamycinicus]
MLFAKFRILGKLALLVLVPLLGVLALTVPIIYNRVDAASTAQDTSDTVQLATRVSTAVLELQEERLLSVGYTLGLVEEPDLVVQSAEAADKVAELLTDDEISLPPALRRSVVLASKLNSTRANVLNGLVLPTDVVQDFTNVITPMIDGLALSTHADLTTSVGQQVFALERAMRSDDLISQASCYLATAVAVSRAPDAKTRATAPLLLTLFGNAFNEIQSIITSSKPYFTDGQYKLYLSTQDAFQSRVGPEFTASLATNPGQALGTLNIRTLFPSLNSVMVLGGFVEKRVAKDVDIAVNGNRDSAIRQAVFVGGGALLLLILVVTLSIFMARAVARPLRRLTVSADRIARAAEAELERVADDEAEAQVRPIRLDPVDVEAQDEIGDLARAFDRVQTTAARLVERQVLGRRNVAQMFGHVGRRTQNLVGRQLSLIDSLERRETDSDRLRELYRLDHMSSRLRRNASALVVLSGSAGSNEHMAPLPLSDVVRLALGEIEDYTRVDVEVPEEIVVVPAVLADLTLLLAELLENSTTFSPPHTTVTVSAEELRGGARLAIIDHGLGLAPERLAEENARLTRRERLDLAPTEVLGLFVVGRLARRHGIEVTLTDTPDGGLTAWIDLSPQHLIARVESLAVAGAQAPPAVPAAAAMPQIPAQREPMMAPVSGALRGNTAEVAIASTAVRTVPGSQQPFDPNVLNRATQTLESVPSWNAFGAQPAVEDPYAGQPVYDAEPVYSPGPAYQEPAYQQPVYQQPDPSHGYNSGIPVAGRVPSALPELPAAGQQSWGAEPALPAAPGWNTPQPSETAWNVPEPAAAAWATPAPAPAANSWDTPAPAEPSWNTPAPAESSWNTPQPAEPVWNTPAPAESTWNTPQPAEPVWNTPAPAVEAPMTSASNSGYSAPVPEPTAPEPAAAPRNGGNKPLRRRVPGSQLPMETGPKQHAAAPSQDDALAARAAFDAFEAGVSRAHETSTSLPAPDFADGQWTMPASMPDLPAPQWNVPAPAPEAAPQWNTPAPEAAPQWNTPAPEPQWNTPAPAPAAVPPPPPPSNGGGGGLTRRVPGATLPRDEPHQPILPPAPTLMDPEQARALMDQFEYGVALALNETQPQPEGQPR